MIKQKFDNLKNKDDAIILGIESSCDETASAVVRGGREVLSNVILSQIEIHKRFGGVVPEVASRNHTLALPNVVDESLKQAGITLSNVDAIAVTYGAGLIGALLTGVSSAKALSYATNIPLIKVNHIEAHVSACYLADKELTPPFIALVVSGGHTLILDVKDYNDFHKIGSTLDDAIGEAFDKVARVVGLPYPGGPNVDKLAKQGKPNIELYKHKKSVRDDFNVSYSGLKTAVINYAHNLKQKGETLNVADLCASFSVCAVDLLVETLVKAVKVYNRKTVCVAGGVASNSYLRQKVNAEMSALGVKTVIPPPVFCTDNAAMVACRAYYSIKQGLHLADNTLNAVSSIPFN